MKRRQKNPTLRRKPVSEGVRCALRSRVGLSSRAVIAAGLMGLAPAAMTASPFPAEVPLAALDGTNGLVLKGIDIHD